MNGHRTPRPVLVLSNTSAVTCGLVAVAVTAGGRTDACSTISLSWASRAALAACEQTSAMLGAWLTWHLCQATHTVGKKRRHMAPKYGTNGGTDHRDWQLRHLIVSRIARRGQGQQRGM